jgi:hypothetical protein
MAYYESYRTDIDESDEYWQVDEEPLEVLMCTFFRTMLYSEPWRYVEQLCIVNYNSGYSWGWDGF